MEKDKRIAALYKILLIYEDVVDKTVSTTEGEYLSYLDRLYVWASGLDNDEIAQTIKGLHELGLKSSHKTVKSVVFHMIDLIGKGAESDGVASI